MRLSTVLWCRRRLAIRPLRSTTPSLCPSVPAASSPFYSTSAAFKRFNAQQHQSLPQDKTRHHLPPQSNSRRPNASHKDSDTNLFRRRAPTPHPVSPTVVSPRFHVPGMKDTPRRLYPPAIPTSKHAKGTAFITLHDMSYIKNTYGSNPLAQPQSNYVDEPKNAVHNLASLYGERPDYVRENGRYDRQFLSRTTITLHFFDPPLIGIGDAPSVKGSDRLANLSLVYQLNNQGLFDAKPSSQPTAVTLSDNSILDLTLAMEFLDYYCRKFHFQSADIQYNSHGNVWESIMSINGRKVGVGAGRNKKDCTNAVYMDVVQYLEKCDPDLWKEFISKHRTGDHLGDGPNVPFYMNRDLSDDIRDLCVDLERSTLYQSKPSAIAAPIVPVSTGYQGRVTSSDKLADKSYLLQQRRKRYLESPETEQIRATRLALPLHQREEEILSTVAINDVCIFMAATGSGKTTQIPQIILDSYIDRGEGAKCNILCTQPRRLAALGVADRVATERGEPLGKTVGYQVRFEHKLPERDGSITFLTIGVFLRKMQSVLADPNNTDFDHRDVDTDLLLVVLKRLIAERKAKGHPIKVILMSATIDPTLFQNYFPDDNNQPAKAISIPGRDERWVLAEPSVKKFLTKEKTFMASQSSLTAETEKDEDMDIPFPLIAATVSHILQESSEGHVLVFLPGWEEISRVQKLLITGRWIVDFNDYEIHLLHSTVPLEAQQAVFRPPKNASTRRIILTTNIAETSVTIPDVVYVVDSARLKENRYDPERHMTSLVTSWIGSSNVNQRAGRAGRHRPGTYYGVLSRGHCEALNTYQTVEMARVDLTNVVMHVKALNFPNMDVKSVLGATIEPPDPQRIDIALEALRVAGAIDIEENLTALGRILLQIPVDVHVGRLVLYGSFFRCLDDALTLAAILSSRDPWLCPMMMKAEARKAKASWLPPDFRIGHTGNLEGAHQFCQDNFLSRLTLLSMQKLRSQILSSLRQAGVLRATTQGPIRAYADDLSPELNEHSGSLPILAALITVASQPKFALGFAPAALRTRRDKKVMMQINSIHNDKSNSYRGPKQIFAFLEKRSSTDGATFLSMATELNYATYILFGAHKLEITHNALRCDDWIPMIGDLSALEDLMRLKKLVGRVANVRQSEGEDEDEAEEDVRPLSQEETQELTFLSRDVVKILTKYHAERQNFSNSYRGR
ncbi:P-loop containing nucleoside triphosphate hydrolase protein [Armillaria mellea]|nr:P-loop containing nucleoside triphosphate hydrolase protein [Armillaria mellea]